MVFISRATSLMTLLIMIVTPPLFSKPFVISDSITKQVMGSYLDYFVDTSGKLSITDISSTAFQEKFRSLPEAKNSFGFTKAVIWLRVIVENKTDHVVPWLLDFGYPLIDDICFYQPYKKDHASHCTGDRKPYSTRPINHRSFVFPVASPAGESTCYVRLASGGSMIISLTAWRESSFMKRALHESIFIWMFYGIMIALIIYNLFIFLSIRELNYLYLSLFAVSNTLHTLSFNGVGFQYLWPNLPEWGNMANLVFNNFVCVFSLLFTRSFLETRLHMPRFDRLMLLAFLSIMATFLFMPFIEYRTAAPVVTFNTGVLLVLYLVSGAYLLAKGSRPARFYMTAWLCMLLGAFVRVLNSFGVIPESFLVTWGTDIGAALLVTLLSLGIADKINVFRREREQALEATREAEEKYRALIETTDTGYVIIDESGRVLDANSEYVRLTGRLTLDDILGKNVTEWTSPADREKNAAAVEACMRDGFIRNLEIEYVHGNGAIVPIEINATVIDSKEGRRILTICRDYTYRKTVMDNLQASLREKDVLLMEIHHRVKNNLQIISSLISLQSGKISDKEVLMLYEDLNSRIRAMSLIHEHLYQTGDFARIDFAEYIMIITVDLQNTYRLYYGDCVVEYDTDHIELDIVKAIPCGLMLNEIISNSFKYAFPPTFEGRATVRISFHEHGGDTIKLVVSDNGVGLPPTVEPEMKKTLGLSLIYLLADQIRGTVTVDREEGTKYTVIFSKS
ncbi:MAG: PAS domain S-box protein [Spirochaetes bacterium]|nr:PAS domain S-box protein [Spirochaetota bacterium]